MKVVVMPGFSELTITVGPETKPEPKAPVSIIMPWLFAPWPEAQKTGRAPLELEGETLRALLNALSALYKQAGTDFEPVDPETDDMDFDYTVLVNGHDHATLAKGLDARLNEGDEVKVKMLWRWDG